MIVLSIPNRTQHSNRQKSNSNSMPVSLCQTEIPDSVVRVKDGMRGRVTGSTQLLGSGVFSLKHLRLNFNSPVAPCNNAFFCASFAREMRYTT